MSKEDQHEYEAFVKFLTIGFFEFKKQKKLQQKLQIESKKQLQNTKIENDDQKQTNSLCTIGERLPCNFCNIEYDSFSLLSRHMQEVHEGINFPYSRVSPINLQSIPDELLQKQEYYKFLDEGSIANQLSDLSFQTPIIGERVNLETRMTNPNESSVEILRKLQKKKENE